MPDPTLDGSKDDKISSDMMVFWEELSMNEVREQLKIDVDIAVNSGSLAASCALRYFRKHFSLSIRGAAAARAKHLSAPSRAWSL